MTLQIFRKKFLFMKHTLCSSGKQVNGFFCCSANTSSYSHYVFSALDTEDSGVITFEVERLWRLKKSKRLCARCVSIVDSGICPWPLRFAEWFFRRKAEVFQIWISTPTYNSFHYHNLHPNLPRRQTVASNYSKLTDVQTCFRWIPAQIA